MMTSSRNEFNSIPIHKNVDKKFSITQFSTQSKLQLCEKICSICQTDWIISIILKRMVKFKVPAGTMSAIILKLCDVKNEKDRFGCPSVTLPFHSSFGVVLLSSVSFAFKVKDGITK